MKSRQLWSKPIQQWTPWSQRRPFNKHPLLLCERTGAHRQLGGMQARRKRRAGNAVSAAKTLRSEGCQVCVWERAPNRSERQAQGRTKVCAGTTLHVWPPLTIRHAPSDHLFLFLCAHAVLALCFACHVMPFLHIPRAALAEHKEARPQPCGAAPAARTVASRPFHATRSRSSLRPRDLARCIDRGLS